MGNFIGHKWVDRFIIVLQAPDESFQSVTKLARYLSGEVKASDVINSTDADEDPIGDKNMPFPNPTKRKKKDIFSDVSRFKTIDENAKNVSFILIHC